MQRPQNSPCPLTFDLLHRLNREAQPTLDLMRRTGRMIPVAGTDPPGVRRRRAIAIRHAPHQPPPPEAVDDALRELLASLNQNWQTRDAAWLAGLTLWRINWIHPYCDGNGRTARSASRIVAAARCPPPDPGGFAHRFERIVIADRPSYYAALRRADAVWTETGTLTAAADAICDDLRAVIDTATATR